VGRLPHCFLRRKQPMLIPALSRPHLPPRPAAELRVGAPAPHPGEHPQRPALVHQEGERAQPAAHFRTKPLAPSRPLGVLPGGGVGGTALSEGEAADVNSSSLAFPNRPPRLRPELRGAPPRPPGKRPQRRTIVTKERGEWHPHRGPFSERTLATKAVVGGAPPEAGVGLPALSGGEAARC